MQELYGHYCVDREKFYAENNDLEDATNHAVVVTYIDDNLITIFDPYKTPYAVKILIPDFLNGWKESHNYMIHVFETVEEYDRLTAFNTIKLVKKLGFSITRRR